LRWFCHTFILALDDRRTPPRPANRITACGGIAADRWSPHNS
jgi:hypothetical protein